VKLQVLDRQAPVSSTAQWREFDDRSDEDLLLMFLTGVRSVLGRDMRLDVMDTLEHPSAINALLESSNSFAECINLVEDPDSKSRKHNPQNVCH